MSTRTISGRIVGRGWPAVVSDAEESLYLGLQRGKEVLDVRACDDSETQFDFALDLLLDELGGAGDWRGSLVHGPRGARFLYLCWGHIGEGEPFVMSSRAKLPLPALEDAAVGRLSAGDVILVATLELADARGRPISGSVRPPHLVWSIA